MLSPRPINPRSIFPRSLANTAIVTSFFAFLIGLIAAHNPIVAIVFGALTALGSIVLASHIALNRYFLALLTLCLTGYMFLDRGFAYIGASPVFVGELLLALSIAAILSRLGHLRFTPHSILILLFMTWGLIRTIPYISTDGLYALRDATLWGYAFIALAISVSPNRSDFLRGSLIYGKASRIFLIWVPVALILQIVFQPLIPQIPISHVPIIYIKPGDLGVHLAGVAAFSLLGIMSLEKQGEAERPVRGLWLFWFSGFALVSSQNRGGLLSILAVLAAISLLRPTRQLYTGMALALIAGVFLTVINPQIDVGRSRSVSPQQILNNLQSVVGHSDEGNLQGTREFRIEWWKKIWDDTVYGPHFWNGRGFGANLAIDYQVGISSDVRAPHNSHVTVLARMGVPGLALWIGMNLSIAFSLLRVFRDRISDAPWLSAMAGWLLMYWLAMMINTAFDPYLEGPQGGIWYWSVMGMALVVIRTAQEPNRSVLAK